ncbi:MAG: Asp-tRNA(Asn)/Glu-tRNA(Gln) amidotransferase subunit GatA, partial [Phycisphaerae bacterium]|nr:Asp-tRNA(Asn)/Glu-tRNA(Gln) amidotransferase subunit GatA [Phycisphaerae bacterium]NIX01126.1 Asp-tRNA(Asn)/Glu-tRNA(Gln) amidotransferase subunit GatA [Phycisphaerae bacterium]NIX26804.1 Asp-tRNA(Asn)/Glu-tRNA(Gln) amidotransferase subunit GatA [Phycisphaerae bacterium]
SAPLLGVPLAVKDNILIAGKPASAASKILEDYVAPYSSTAAERLQAAGAVLIGRTNMDEFAMGSSTE